MRLTGYELVRLPKANSDHPVWTWRMTEENYTGWRERVIECARKKTGTENKLIASLYGSPGFHGIRSHVGKIAGLFRREWKRHRQTDKFPTTPKLHYAQRLPNSGTLLSKLA